MKTRFAVVMVAVASMTVTFSAAATAQNTLESIANRVSAVKNGTVRMSFAAREDVCGDGNNWIRTGSRTQVGSNVSTYGSREVDVACDKGPVRIVVDRADGYTIDIRAYVGGRWRVNDNVTDIGTVSAPAAALWLISVAENDQDAVKAARGAILGATLADSSKDIWKPLLRIARNNSRSREVRNQAVFWVASIAGDKVTASLDSMAYEAGNREVRQQAIFAISQRPAEESVPLLIRMAETIKDRDLRKNAIFWLGQTKDPRAVAWFEQVLTAGK